MKLIIKSLISKISIYSLIFGILFTMISCKFSDDTSSAGALYHYTPPSDHIIPKYANYDYYHAPDMYDPYGSLGGTNCTDCHGTTLRGTTGYDDPGTAAIESYNPPSCLQCHTTFLPPSSHTESMGGYKHATGLYDPTNVSGLYPTNVCTSCHETDLYGKVDANGKTPPSCYQCHTNVWNNPAHNDSKDGYGHGSNGNCTICHGTNFTGGTQPSNGKTANSCYQCHDNKWN